MPKSFIQLKKASFLGGFFVVIFLVLTSCTTDKADGKMVFRYNEPAGIPSLDPAFAKEKSSIWVVQQLYEGLVALDSENAIVPALALEWEIDSTAKVYTFRLRNASFHNGKPLAADDVVYSLNRLRDAKVASPGSWVSRRYCLLENSRCVYGGNSLKTAQFHFSFFTRYAVLFCSSKG